MKRVIIVGGGYGGIKALETLAKAKLDLEILLIDKNSFHYIQTESYNFVISSFSLKEITLSLNHLVQGIGVNAVFINDEAITVDNSTLICKKGIYTFDYLIIATGTVTKKPKIFDNFLDVKDLQQATVIKQRFEKLVLEHLQKKRNCSNIAVAGGGSSGIEIAASMQYFINELKLNSEISVTVIADLFLSELDEKSKKRVIDILGDLGLNLKQCLIDKIQGNTIFIKDEKITFDLGVAATGLDTNSFIKNLPFKKSNGFLVTDEYLRVSDNIFAAGDCAVMKDKNGKILPPTAQIAEQSGTAAAKNVICSIKHRPLKKSDLKIYGLAIALGGKFAIIKAGFFQFDGILAYLGKKAIENYYKIPLKMKEVF